MTEDSELLRLYIEHKSQDAFAELVRRRVDFVYSVALRHVGGDAHLAQDVTQKVFTDLARKAATLAQRAVLTGWLHRSTQFAASDAVRAERRRRTREQASQVLHDIEASADTATDWERLRPLLDDAMGELNENDRDAVALRFFEERSFAEIGRVLRLTEEAARKRVDRALDTMAAALSRRGVRSTTAALSLAFMNQPTVAAPAGLAAVATTAALAGLAGGGAVTTAAGAAAVGFMASTKVALTATAIALLAVGTNVWQANTMRTMNVALAERERQQEELRAEVTGLRHRLEAAEERAQAAENDSGLLLQAIATSQSGPPAAEPMNYDLVQARYREAQELARRGEYEAALREFLWCYDEGMVRVPHFNNTRQGELLRHIALLGRRYPPALDALRERRDAAEQSLRANSYGFEAAVMVAGINRVLNESGRTVAVLDSLRAGDSRRLPLAAAVFDQLREQRRYADAEEGMSSSQMRAWFELAAAERPVPPGTPDPERLRQARRRSAITTAAKALEVLAGVGKLEDARVFAARVLAFDASPETRELLEKHAARAGRPELLANLPAS